MKLRLSPEQEAAAAVARAFADEHLRAHAARIDEQGVGRELAQKLAGTGLLGALIPEELGGKPLDPVAWGLALEEIGKVCTNTRYLLVVHAGIVAGTLARWGSPAQKQAWLPRLARGERLAAFAITEPEVGSDASNIRTSYVPRGAGFALNGRKRWITFAGLADVLLVVARNGDEMSAFLVERDRPGVRVEPLRGLMVGRGSHLAEITLENVELPPESVVGKLGAGFKFVTSTALDHGRYSVAWSAVGLAQGALEAMTTYATTREQFGKLIHEHQLVRAMIADAVTSTHAARALCMHVGELRRAGEPEALIETSIAKQFAAQVATRVTTNALQVHGANGFDSRYGVERLFREARVLEIIEGSTQIHQNVIGNYAARAYRTKNVGP